VFIGKPPTEDFAPDVVEMRVRIPNVVEALALKRLFIEFGA
jgi:hypothetical protein